MLVQKIIDKVRDVVVQIATPFNTGTGFFIEKYNLIVTNEHVVRENRLVVIRGEGFEKQSVRVLLLDEKYDLAFLEAPSDHAMKGIDIVEEPKVRAGHEIIAVGHPFGMKFSATQGIISNLRHRQHNIDYIQHDAALNPGNSGGPLVSSRAQILGVNTFILREGNNIGFSLPIRYVVEILDCLNLQEGTCAKCPACATLVYEHNIADKYCYSCGTEVLLPSQILDYRPSGIKKTIETMLSELSYEVALCRKGPNQWMIEEGSAQISISYHPESGQICADAHLCRLPKENVQELYTYLLRENYKALGISLSVREQDIVLTLLIFDRHLEVHTAIELMKRMFQKADYYDDILIDRFGALPMLDN